MPSSGRPSRRKSSLPKLIEKYYADLADFARQNVLFEMGTRHAFHRLMADAGKEHKWTLIAEQEKKVGGKTIRPDGTFKDEMNLVRGYWEAKDTSDKLSSSRSFRKSSPIASCTSTARSMSLRTLWSCPIMCMCSLSSPRKAL
jgi:hypothetical protein